MKTKDVNMQIKPFLFPALVIAIGLLAQGCSFSYSSKSSSKSSLSSSKSSASILSSPSSSLTEEEIYQEDIMDYTSAYLHKEKFDRDTFNRGISEIATDHGVISWEQDDATYVAIGRGLKEADLPKGVFQSYKSTIANSDSYLMSLIQKGHDEQ